MSSNGVPEEYLLVSDLDQTLLGDPVSLRHFAAYRESLADRIRLSLIYASGRFCSSMLRDIEETGLPSPIALIGGAGTEIRMHPEGGGFPEWNEAMRRRWSAMAVRETLAGQARLRLQDEKNQSDYKVSYRVENATRDEREGWSRLLGQSGIRAEIIYSSNRDLDVLPEGVNKGTAARFLAGKLGYAREQILVAGNSANDADLFGQGFRGIIVDNAHDELKAAAAGDLVYLSPYPLADGVRDGVQHWLDRRQMPA